MFSLTEGTEGEGEEAEAGDSLAEGPSLLLAAVGGTEVGTAMEEGKGSSGSTVEQGSGMGALDSILSTGASGCTTPGEEDFWTTGSSFGVSPEGTKSGNTNFNH